MQQTLFWYFYLVMLKRILIKACGKKCPLLSSSFPVENPWLGHAQKYNFFLFKSFLFYLISIQFFITLKLKKKKKEEKTLHKAEISKKNKKKQKQKQKTKKQKKTWMWKNKTIIKAKNNKTLPRKPKYKKHITDRPTPLFRKIFHTHFTFFGIKSSWA